MASPDIYWKGASGKEYGYWIHEIGTKFNNLAGNYIYANEERPGFWNPIYIGQTLNLSDRLADHEKESCIALEGATHIHTHTSSTDESVRLAEEKDLVDKWNPACNE